MPPWIDSPIIDVEASRLDVRAIPPNMLDEGRRLLAAMRAEMPAEMPAAALLLADAVNIRTRFRFAAECKSVARAVDAGWREIMLLNCAYDLIIGYIHCSTVAVESPEGPILARNMDFWPEDALARASCLLRAFDGGNQRFCIAGWPGSIGVVSAMSARGFALTLNAVISDEPPRRTGYPVMLFLRTVIEDAADFDAAVDMITRAGLASHCLIVVVGSQHGQRVVIERTPTQAEQRWGQPGSPLVATNHYRALTDEPVAADDPLSPSSCGRYDTLAAAFECEPDTTDEAFLYALSDPRIMQGITAQQMVFRPSIGSARLVVPRRFFESSDG